MPRIPAMCQRCFHLNVILYCRMHHINRTKLSETSLYSAYLIASGLSWGSLNRRLNPDLEETQAIFWIRILAEIRRPERGGPCLLLKLRQIKTYGVQMKGVHPWFVRWPRRASSRDFYSSLAALVNPVQNMFFLTVHYFTWCVPIAQQARHGKAVVQGRLSLNACLR